MDVKNNKDKEICQNCGYPIEECICNETFLPENANVRIDESLNKDESGEQDIANVIDKYLSSETSSDEKPNLKREEQIKAAEKTEKEKYPTVLFPSDKKTSKIKVVLSHLSCFILSIVLVAMLTLATMWTALRYSIENKAIHTAVMQVDMGSISLDDGSDTVINEIYDGVVYNLPVDIEIDKNSIADFLNEEVVKGFITQKLINYTDYFKGESYDAGVKSREIVEFIKENEELLYSYINYRPTSHDYLRIEEGLTEAEFEKRLSLSSVQRSLDLNLEPIRGFLSKYVLIVLCVIIIVLIISMAIINKENISVFFVYLGSVFMVEGFSLVITIFTAGIVFSISKTSFSWIKAFISAPEKTVQNMGVIFLALGIILIAAAIFIRKKIKISAVKNKN